MAINKKNKNRVKLNKVEYLWWVFDETDQTEFDSIQIKIVCSDQTHFIKYGLDQSEKNRKVVLELRDYTKLIHLADPPIFENKKGIITRTGVIRLIEWCKKEEHKIQYAVSTTKYELSYHEKFVLLKELQSKIDLNSIN